MEELILKYNLLDDFSKQKLLGYLEQLLNIQRSEKPKKNDSKEPAPNGVNPPINHWDELANNFSYQDFRRKLLEIKEVWPENDINIYEENRKTLNEWSPKEW